MKVFVKKNLNVRKGSPSVSAVKIRILQSGASVEIIQALTGDKIDGNDVWYVDADGNYIWSGGLQFPEPVPSVSWLNNSGAITTEFLESIEEVKFSNSEDVNTFFKSKVQTTFIKWFNINLSGKEHWKGITMANDAGAQNRFDQLWNQIPVIFGTSFSNLLQFISLMSIVNNETGGIIQPKTEGVNRINRPDNPGIAYAFNRIPGLKRSYNTLAGNKTAYDLFHDPNYKNQHGNLSLSEILKDTANTTWKGETYPIGVSVATDSAVNGFVLEADFYKFRGRGFIQTTGRVNYKGIIDFIEKYTGTNAVVNKYQVLWQNKDSDTIATISTNKDWDELFQKTDLIIPAAAISIHDKASGNYLSKIAITPEVDAAIRSMGLKISGGSAYADLFLKRVIQICNGLGNT